MSWHEIKTATCFSTALPVWDVLTITPRQFHLMDKSYHPTPLCSDSLSVEFQQYMCLFTWISARVFYGKKNMTTCRNLFLILKLCNLPKGTFVGLVGLYIWWRHFSATVDLRFTSRQWCWDPQAATMVITTLWKDSYSCTLLGKKFWQVLSSTTIRLLQFKWVWICSFPGFNSRCKLASSWTKTVPLGHLKSHPSQSRNFPLVNHLSDSEVVELLFCNSK